MNRRRCTYLLLLITILLSEVNCFAQDEMAEMAVETISGEKLSGNLQQVDASGNLVGEGFEGVNIEQVLSISTSLATAGTKSRTSLGLVDGGRLFVAGTTVDGESIRFSKNAIGLSEVSLQAVRSIVFKESELIREAISQSPPDQDTVIVAKKSSLSRASGVLESMDSAQLMLNFKGASRPVKRDKIAAIVIADLDLAPPKGIIATASFVDGSTIKGALVGFNEKAVSMELTGKQTVDIAREHLVRIDISSESIAYLSTLEPSEVRQQPQFTVLRHWQRNRSVEGNPIRLLTNAKGSEINETTQVTTFDNGIGTSSYSRLVFENTNDFSRFLATVGIDAETEGRGDCEMRVEGDGITLWSQRVRGSDIAIDIDVDVSGISQIALIVDPGEQFDLADHADWARARFLKTE